MSIRNKRMVLIILDGWGIGDGTVSDAIHCAETPFFDELISDCPHARLRTDGESVGLPAGQMGNSEVGHLNIGAGRIVYQDLVKINKAVSDDLLKENPVLNESFRIAKDRGCRFHLMGLLSPGGIHSHQKHLHYLCRAALERGLKEIYVHAFTDGRDCDPHSGMTYVKNLETVLENTNAQLVSVIGRYYAMDRDKRWERIRVAYDMLIKGIGAHKKNLLSAMQQSYDNGISDEFIKPIVRIGDKGEPIGRIQHGDVVICFNFRTDRCRELTTVLNYDEMPELGMKPLDLHYVTMTRYDDRFNDLPVLFDKENIKNTLGEVLARSGKKQLRIAETEKYPHVTFFFSGGREQLFPGESRILINSPKVATYDMKPEMSAVEVTEKLCEELDKQEMDFVCINYANADMVGHTGVYEAIIKAVETVDDCLRKVIACCRRNHYAALLIADHGNSDHAVNEDGTPNTAHSMNPVPCILIQDNASNGIKDGKLADIAPSILFLMGLSVPPEMKGEILIG